MLKRIYDVVALALLVAGLGGAAVGYHFLYHRRFIEGVVAGLLAFVLLRTGLLILRLLTARSSLSESHRRIVRHLNEDQSPEDRTSWTPRR